MNEELEEDEELMCMSCAKRSGAIHLNWARGDWYDEKCDFCGNKTQVCYVEDYTWLIH